jgi:hypothetical protein
MRTRARQRGWAGLIGLLIALAIVLLLGRTVLQQTGVLTSHSVTAQTPLSRQLAPDAPSAQAASAMPSFAAPIERARSVETIVQDQAREAAARVERNAQ